MSRFRRSCTSSWGETWGVPSPKSSIYRWNFPYKPSGYPPSYQLFIILSLAARKKVYDFSGPRHRFVECRSCQRTPVVLRKPLLNALHLIGVAVFRHHRIFEELLGDRTAKFCWILRQMFDLGEFVCTTAELKGGRAPSEGFCSVSMLFFQVVQVFIRRPIFLKCIGPGVTSPAPP